MGKRRSEDYILVSVTVHPVLRDYIVSTNGSPVLVPDDKGPLWVAVKSHLLQCPADYKPLGREPEPGEIRIVLPPISSTNSPLLNINIDEIIHTNFLFRNYLDRKGQRMVADLLMKTFKDRYRAFMTGYLASHPNQGTDSQIKDGIDEFCRIHRITMDDKITYEMLRKDWYRFRTRESPSDFCDDVKENI